MAKLSVEIEDELLQRARARAREQGDSLDAVVPPPGGIR